MARQRRSSLHVRNAAIVAARLAGSDLSKLGKRYGLSQARISSICKAHAAEVQNPPMGELAYANPANLFKQSLIEPFNPSVLVTRKGLVLFDKMRQDDQIKAAQMFKKFAAVNTGWEIVSPEGEGPEWEPTLFIKDQLLNVEGSFSTALINILTALDYGYSVTEKVFQPIEEGSFSGKIGLRALKSKSPFGFDFITDVHGSLLPDGLCQRQVENSPRLPIIKFVIYSYQAEFGNHYGKSDLEAAYRPWWIKENAYRWLAMLLERFGIPPIFALYDPTSLTAEQIQALQTVLERLQASTAGVIPRSDKDSLEMWSPELAGNAQRVFIPALQMFNKDIARALLMPDLLGASSEGQTGSFARARVQFDVFLLLLNHIRHELADLIVMDQVIRPLVKLNYDVDKFPVFRFLPITDATRIDLMKQWGDFVGIKVVKAQAEDEIHIREAFGFPTRADASDDDFGPAPGEPAGEPAPGEGGARADGETGVKKGPDVELQTEKEFDMGGRINSWDPIEHKIFVGPPVELKAKLTKKEVGEFGEALAIRYLNFMGFDGVTSLNYKRNNFPLDLFNGYEVIEVKTGLVSNTKSAQQWRNTFGSPGKREAAWLETISSEEKWDWNKTKEQKILERKLAAVSDFSKKTGQEIQGSTLAMILNPDLAAVDIYKFEGFHSRIGWNSDVAKTGYVGSFRYE